MTDWTWPSPSLETFEDLNVALHPRMKALENKLAGVQGDLGIFDPKDYGAKGDGVTNDTVAFEAVRTAVEADPSLLFVRSGDFLLLDSIYFTVAGTSVSGIGRASRVIAGATSTFPSGKYILRFEDITDFGVDNLFLDGSVVTVSNVHGLAIDNCQRFSLRNLHISGPRICISITGASEHFIVSGCHLDTTEDLVLDPGGSAGINLDPADISSSDVLRHFVLVHNIIRNGTTGISIDAGPDDNGFVRNGTVVGNICSGQVRDAFTLDGQTGGTDHSYAATRLRNISLVSNVATSAGRAGFHLQGGHYSSVVLKDNLAELCDVGFLVKKDSESFGLELEGNCALGSVGAGFLFSGTGGGNRDVIVAHNIAAYGQDHGFEFLAGNRRILFDGNIAVNNTGEGLITAADEITIKNSRFSDTQAAATQTVGISVTAGVAHIESNNEFSDTLTTPVERTGGSVRGDRVAKTVEVALDDTGASGRRFLFVAEEAGYITKVYIVPHTTWAGATEATVAIRTVDSGGTLTSIVFLNSTAAGTAWVAIEDTGALLAAFAAGESLISQIATGADHSALAHIVVEYFTYRVVAE